MRSLRLIDVNYYSITAVLMAIGLTLFCWQVAIAQEPSVLQLRKSELEIDKIQLEVMKLKEDFKWQWFTPFLSFVTGIVGAGIGFFFSSWAARKLRAHAVDLATHEKRLECYPQLVQATSPLAVHFPDAGPLVTVTLDRHVCHDIGRAMSKWYFEAGGLLLSTEARNAYFRLARALARAASVEALTVPIFLNDAQEISVEKLRSYRCDIERKLRLNLDDVEKWSFGSSEIKVSASEPYLKFKDYIFLQRLSSSLRTRLTEDLFSRRAPEAQLAPRVWLRWRAAVR